MPKRLTIQDLKRKFEKYGYTILDDNYKNNKQKLNVYDAQLGKKVKLNVLNMNYAIKKNKRAEFDMDNILPVALNPEQEQRERFNVYDVLPVALQPVKQKKEPIFDIYGILPVAQQQQPKQQQTPFRRFLNRLANNKAIQDATEEDKKKMFQYYNTLVKLFGRKKPVSLQWNNSPLKSKHQLFIFIEALKSIIKPNKMIKIKTIDKDGVEVYYSLTHETINYFIDLLNDKPKSEMADSTSDIFDDYSNWVVVDLEFNINIKQHGGFFPYINKSSYPLEVYGIFSEFDINNYSTNCFIQAIRNSNEFTENEMKLISSCVNTRLVKIEDIQAISNLMKTHIVVRIWDENNNKWILKQFKPKDNIEHKITLLLYQYHFMANQQLHISKYYIENSKLLDEKYPNNPERFIMDDAEGNLCQLKMSIITMIKLFHENNLFEPIPVEDQLKIALKYNKQILDQNDIVEQCFREKVVKMPNSKQTQAFIKLKHYDGYKLFCEHLKYKQVDEYYAKLQTIIDSLGVSIDVKGFTSYPSLMEAIMYK